MKNYPVYHAMKFGADFGNLSSFLSFMRVSLSLPLNREWENAQQAVSSIIHVRKNSEIKIQFYKGNNEPKSLRAKIRFQENFDYSKNFPNQFKLHGMIYRGNFSLTKG